MGRRGVVIVVGSMLGAACVGAACVVDIPDVVNAGDAGSDAIALSDVVVPACDAGACGAPSGFAPVLFALDRGSTCPPGTQTFDLPADPGEPEADAGACGCDCNVTTAPSCFPLVVNHKIDSDGGSCNTTSSFKPLLGSGCNVQTGVQVAADWGIAPSAPTDAGTCSGSATPNPSAVPATASRICADPSCGTCAAPPGFQVCFASTSVAACPTGMTPHTIGSGIDVQCSSCSACSITSKCGGTILLYSDDSCQTPIGVPVPVNGACTATQSDAAPLGSMQYVPAAVDLACKPGQSSALGATLVAPVMICCP